MKIMPVASPHAIQQPQGNSAAQQDAKARAISILTGQNAGGNAPVQNQNAIQPEEMGVLGVKKDEEELEASGQADSQVAESTEVTEETKEPVVAEDPALSRQFAQLARQEKQLRLKAQQQEQAIKAREQALAEREALLTAKDEQYKSGYIPKDRISKDTWGVLAEAGITYDTLTEQILNQNPTDPRMEAHISRLEAKIKELEGKQEDTSKQYKDQQSAAYQAAVKQIAADVKTLVYTDEAFETIKETGSYQDVVDLITETYNKDGVLLSVEEAAQEVENYLFEETLKLTNIKKIKQRLSQAGSATQTTQAASKPAGTETKQPLPMKTLTNAASSTRQLSAKERAILAFKGELKS